MGRNIGEVDFIVDFDGRGLPGKARKLGNEAGAAGGQEFSDGFSKELTGLGRELREFMQREGELSGTNFTESMRNVIRRNQGNLADDLAEVFGRQKGLSEFVSKVGNVDDALGQLRDKMGELNAQGGLSAEMYDNLSGQLDAFAQKNRDAADVERERLRVASDLGAALDKEMIGQRRYQESLERNTEAFERNRLGIRRFLPDLDALRTKLFGGAEGSNALGNAMDGMAAKVDKASSSGRRFKRDFNFNSLPDQLQDILFYGALFLALGNEIAVLGSVAGSSLVTLGGTVTALALAVGVGIAGFKGMLGEMSEIDPRARGASRALRDLGKGFGEIKKTIQGNMFEDLEGPIDNLGSKLLPVLDKGFGATASTINGVFRRALERITTPRALEKLDQLLIGMQPTISNLGDLVLNLGSGLGSLFIAALPSMEKFTGYLADATARFEAFLQSPQGQKDLTEFFDTLGSVMPHIVDLLGDVGGLLASLVTPTTIGQLNDALDALGDFMPTLKDIFDVVSDLDPLGLLTDALGLLSDIIGPMTPGLRDLAGALGDMLSKVLSGSGDDLGKIAASVGDLLSAVADSGAIEEFGELVLGIVKLTSLVGIPIVDSLADLIDALSGSDAKDAAKNADDLGNSSLFTIAEKLGAAAAGNIQLFALAIEAFKSAVNDGENAVKDPNFLERMKKALDGITFGNADEIIGLLTGIGTAFDTFGDNVEEFNDQIREAFGKSGGPFGPVVEAFRGFGSALDTFAATVEGANDRIRTFFTDFGDDVESFNEDIRTFFGEGGGPFGPVIDAFNTVVEFFNGLGWDAIWQGAVDGILNPFKDFEWSSLFTGGEEAASTSATSMGNSFSVTPPLVGTHLSPLTSQILTWFQSSVPGVQSVAGQLGNAFQPTPLLVGGFLGTIGTKIVSYFATAPGPVQAIASQIGQIWATPPTTIGGFMSRVGQTIITPFTQVPGPVGAIATQVVNLWPSVPSRIMGALGDIGGRIGGAFSGAVAAAGRTVSGIVSAFASLPGRILGAIGNIAATVASRLNFSNAVVMPRIPLTAVGGVFDGAQARIIGEAGPEAVVPLDRDLNQVDPAVRALSAIAQGKQVAAPAGEGKTVIVEAGAVQVTTAAREPGNVGDAVLDAIVANLPD